MRKLGAKINACIKSYPKNRRLKREEEQKEREAQEAERQNRERRQRAIEAAEDRSQITVPPPALRRDAGNARPNRSVLDTAPRYQSRGLRTANNTPVRSIRRKPLKEAIESVNPLLAEDDPKDRTPTIYGAGSRYHGFSRPVTSRASEQNLEQPTTTGESSESGALQRGAPAELPLPRRRRRLPNRDATRRQGRVFHDNDLPEVLRIQYVSPIAVNPLTPHDEEELHITPRSSTWGPMPSSRPILQRNTNVPVPALGGVANGSIARRRARPAERPQDAEPSASFHAQVSRDRSERNSLAEVFALPGHYGNGHLPLPPAIATLPDAVPSEAERENEHTSTAASNTSVPGHYSSASASAESLAISTTSSTRRECDTSPASSLISLPSYLAPGRLPRHLRTPTPSPQPSLLSIPRTRQQRILSPASSLISLPSYLASHIRSCSPSIRASTLSFQSLLSISTESTGTASLRRNLMRVLYEHALTHQRGAGGGSGRSSMQSFSTSSSTREIFEGVVELLEDGRRGRRSRALESVSEGPEITETLEAIEASVVREVVGPVAYGTRATTARDVLRRRASRGNLRLESTAGGSDSVTDGARDTSGSADAITYADRNATGAEAWRTMLLTPSGQHVNPDIMTTALDGVIEPGLGEFRIEF